jgi:hypothetical protein
METSELEQKLDSYSPRLTNASRIQGRPESGSAKAAAKSAPSCVAHHCVLPWRYWFDCLVVLDSDRRDVMSASCA